MPRTPRAGSPIDALIRDFTEHLTRAIEQQVQQTVVSALRGNGGGGGAGALRSRPRGPINPARRLQGQYLGRLRKLTGKDRARVRAAAKNEGVAAAVKLADKILGR